MGIQWLQKIVNDPHARQEFFKWADRKNESIAPTAAEPLEAMMRSVNLSADTPHKKVSALAGSACTVFITVRQSPVTHPWCSAWMTTTACTGF